MPSGRKTFTGRCLTRLLGLSMLLAALVAIVILAGPILPGLWMAGEATSVAYPGTMHGALALHC